MLIIIFDNMFHFYILILNDVYQIIIEYDTNVYILFQKNKKYNKRNHFNSIELLIDHI